MADNPHPFNSLGQILSGGGANTLSLGLSLGRSNASMRQQLEKRFGTMPDETWNELTGIAEAQIDAGEYIGSLPPNELPDTSRIPINEKLFGDQPTGDRFCYESQYTDPTTGEQKLFRLNSPVPLTMAQIAAAASLSTQKSRELSPEKWSGIDPQSVSTDTLQPLFAGRCH